MLNGHSESSIIAPKYLQLKTQSTQKWQLAQGTNSRFLRILEVSSYGSSRQLARRW